MFGESSGEIPGENPNPPEDLPVEPLRQAARIITYDTLLCYLYPPPSMAGNPVGDGSVIKGWDKGVATMEKGEVAELFCRSDYAYGDKGSPPKIPGGATLKFEVELINWAEPVEVDDIDPVDLAKSIYKIPQIAST